MRGYDLLRQRQLCVVKRRLAARTAVSLIRVRVLLIVFYHLNSRGKLRVSMCVQMND